MPARTTLPTNLVAGNSGHVGHSNSLHTFYNAAGGGPLPLVAAAGAPTAVKDRANYVCDGTADEVEINLALAENAGGVQLSSGVFNTATPILVQASGQHLRGVGWGFTGTGGAGEPYGGGTVIRPVVGFTGTAVVRVAYATGQAYSSICLGYATVSDLVINGNSKTGTGIDGIHFRVFQGVIARVIVDGCSGNGIHLNGYSGWATYDTKLSDLLVMRNGAAGVLFGQDCADDHLMNSVIFDNALSGIQMGTATASTASHQITQVHLYANDQCGIHFVAGGDRTKIANCKIEGNDRDGIFLDGTVAMPSGVQVVNCNFGSHSNAATNTYSHVRADAGVSGGHQLQVTGCEFGNPYSFTNLCHSAVYVGSQPRYFSISANQFGDATPGSVGAQTGVVTITLNQGYHTIRGNGGVHDYYATHANVTPTLTAAAGAGSAAPTPQPVGAISDARGRLTFGTGSAPTAGGAYVTVTFARPFSWGVPTVTLTPANQATADARPFLSAVSASSFSVGLSATVAGGAANSTYAINWRAVG